MEAGGEEDPAGAGGLEDRLVRDDEVTGGEGGARDDEVGEGGQDGILKEEVGCPGVKNEGGERGGMGAGNGSHEGLRGLYATAPVGVGDNVLRAKKIGGYRGGVVLVKEGVVRKIIGWERGEANVLGVGEGGS